MKGISLVAVVISLVGYASIAHCGPAQAKPSSIPHAVAKQQSRYQDAESVWQNIARQNPDRAEAYYNLGIAQAHQKKWTAAIASYERTITLNPSLVNAFCNLGHAQMKLGQYQAAAQSYRRALELDPQEPLALALLTELKIIARGNGVELGGELKQPS